MIIDEATRRSESTRRVKETLTRDNETKQLNAIVVIAHPGGSQRRVTVSFDRLI